MTIELPHKVKQWNNFCGEKCVSLWLCTSNVFGQSAFDTTEDELGIPEHSLGGLSWNRKYHFFLNVPIKVAINGTIPYVFRHAHILLRQRYPIILKFWFWWPLNWVSHWKNSISGAIKAKLGFKFSKWSPSLSLVYDVRRVPNLRWLSFYYPNIHPSTGVNT
jgi:hypothetical protein